ncbi:hypothetical protein ACIBCC_30215 [Streptomyces griseus]|uniref:hypothetical protein n=1 Tax=Streptomyces griseus TaxID=1911 RepID=UPI0037AC22BB
MTRYGFSYKALPAGGKPFGDDEDDETQETPPLGGEDAPGPDTAAADELSPPEPPTGPSPASAPPEPEPDAPAADEPAAPGQGDGAAQPEEAPQPPADDSRPWAGDRYDQGDETDPEAALYGYTGTGDEQAWLDKDLDGTLTGWVRDGTGKVWRYTDVDAWAADVDGAQMTRTHSRADDGEPDDRGEQDLMFANT